MGDKALDNQEGKILRKIFQPTFTKAIPFREDYPAKAEIIVYGVAHPGARGLYNIGGSEEVMKQSWIKIAEDMY